MHYDALFHVRFHREFLSASEMSKLLLFIFAKEPFFFFTFRVVKRVALRILHKASR